VAVSVEKGDACAAAGAGEIADVEAPDADVAACGVHGEAVACAAAAVNDDCAAGLAEAVNQGVGFGDVGQRSGCGGGDDRRAGQVELNGGQRRRGVDAPDGPVERAAADVVGVGDSDGVGRRALRPQVFFGEKKERQKKKR